ncbi:MAG: hypothetical protein KDC05_13465 [Bacteroidales bacterium]|nr:hypothetical protein [Bacteroidales bacterium]
MKTKTIFVLICLLVVPGFIALSQDNEILKSKKGIPILPQAGDWAIGIDARPFTQLFNYDSDMNFDFPTGYTLIGKKFITDKMAHRFKARLSFYSQTNDEFVIEDEQLVPDPLITVTDTRVINSNVIDLGYGIEKRTGYGRLQALYGGEVMVGYSQTSVSYSYGNSFSATNPLPTSHNFGSNIPEYGKRVVYQEPGYDLSFGLRAFIGIEYFVAPKICLGGEFGFGPEYSISHETKTKIEYYDPEKNAVKEDIEKNGGSKYFMLDNDNFNGVIYLMFHF